MTEKMVNNAGVTVYAPDLLRDYEPLRPNWALPQGKKLAVSLLLHAPAYQDNVLDGTPKPSSMQGGVGRDTAEPRHGQVARLSQWDFGIAVGIFRLMSIAEAAGVPYAVALDEYGVDHAPGLAAEVGRRANELVARGQAANVVFSEAITEDEERTIIRRAVNRISAVAGRNVGGWFSPERATSTRTHALLAEQGLSWFGEWPVDEVPVHIASSSGKIVSLPFALESEDMFSLYTRGLRFDEYEQLLRDTVEQLLADADDIGARFLGLSWFGWVLGQACFADVAERFLGWLAQHPDVEILTPAQAAALASQG